MIKINLLPPEIRKKAEKKRMVALAGLGVLVFVLIIFGVYGQKVLRYRKLARELKRIENELRRLDPVLKEIEQKQREKEVLVKKYQVMKDLMRNTLIYPQFFEELVNLLPDNVWFSNLTTKSSPESPILEVNLDASALDNYAIADFLVNLEKKGCFTDIELGAIQKTGEEREAVLNFRLTFRYQRTYSPSQK